MLLLTGATGSLGSALLPRLTAAGLPVRCLVRDPLRLGAERVRVQIALGDLADPPSFRNALRGVDTVIHLAAARRDQPGGSIEELGAIATWRMVEAAERAGVEHFVFLSALGATAHDRTRYLRAKAVAEDAVSSARMRTTVLAPSLLYAPGDALLTRLERLRALPVVPVVGGDRARFQPIWAEDAAACAVAALAREPRETHERFELAGPETLSPGEIARLVQRRDRPALPLPVALVRGTLRTGEALLGARTPLTWDEAELSLVPSVSAGGTAGARELGVEPRAMADVLGVAP